MSERQAEASIGGVEEYHVTCISLGVSACVGLSSFSFPQVDETAAISAWAGLGTTLSWGSCGPGNQPIFPKCLFSVDFSCALNASLSGHLFFLVLSFYALHIFAVYPIAAFLPCTVCLLKEGPATW